jgi:hypothetical protein
VFRDVAFGLSSNAVCLQQVQKGKLLRKRTSGRGGGTWDTVLLRTKRNHRARVADASGDIPKRVQVRYSCAKLLDKKVGSYHQELRPASSN